jgi:putative ABC transport system permease protein
MIQLYNIRIAFRHLWQNKLYTAINVIGLAVGISCVLLAVLYWNDERSFDGFHKNYANLYRVTTTLSENKRDARHMSGGTGQVQGPAFKAAVPEVMDYTRVFGGGIFDDVRTGDKNLRLQTLFVDDNFLALFDFRLLSGDPRTVLEDMSAAVITESAALRLFGSTDVVGRALELAGDPSAKRLGKPMRVAGVVKNPPVNSSIQFDLLLPIKFVQLSFTDDNWLNAYLGTFVLLRPGADPLAVSRKFDRVYALHAGEQLAANIKNYGFDPQVSYGLQPLADVHLHPLGGGGESGIVNGSSPLYSYLFFGIAAFILLMAGINFVNISIADSLKRAKEVGVRKIIGGSRGQIVFHFLLESVLVCALAFLVAGLVSGFALPVFNQVAGKQIGIGAGVVASLVMDLVVIFLAIVLLTGVYPAWVLSGFSAKEALYKRHRLFGGGVFGKSLVVFQFSIAVVLLISTLVYSGQMNFIRTKDLGYNPHEVVQTEIIGGGAHLPIYRLLKSELGSEPTVRGISFGEGLGKYEVISGDRSVAAVHMVIDADYLPVMEIPLKAGRNFSAALSSDSSHSLIVNEAFVKAAGLDVPIGARIRMGGSFDKEPRAIVGVIKDYHSGSLREVIPPMVFFMSSAYGEEVFVKLDKRQFSRGLSMLEKAYKAAAPQAVYAYHFLDELNAKQYEQEWRWDRVIGVATTLSIVICCLGLFGLAHLAANQRVKEIGIRKVLGASVFELVTFLSVRFLKLVVVGILIAMPVAWLVMRSWLQGFAYRITVGVWVFVVADLIAVGVALLAVGYQAVGAARVNPVRSLRGE